MPGSVQEPQQRPGTLVMRADPERPAGCDDTVVNSEISSI